MHPSFLKTLPHNLTPQTRTPWAGNAISRIKSRYFPSDSWPAAIGESWEVSTDPQFPSQTFFSDGHTETLEQVLQIHSQAILGVHFAEQFGGFCPILLKWIEANSLLSVQVHPTNNHPALRPSECGKPEAWLILDAQPGSQLYLGFRDGVTQALATSMAQSDRFPELLHTINPHPLDFISIPPGCVHALGPGILVAEPQVVLPGRSGKTWRLNDWNRRYDTAGNLSPTGQPRELHVAEALSAIDWTLPTGKELESRLIHRLAEGNPIESTPSQPFRARIFTHEGITPLRAQETSVFRLLTVWGGRVLLEDKNTHERLEMTGGESAIIAAEASHVEIQLQRHKEASPAAALFELDPEADLWRS